MKQVIEVKNLVKRFKNPATLALDGVSFSVYDGEFCALVGPDAAGKTTTCRITAGILSSDEGGVTVFDKNIATDTLAIQERLSYVPQKFGLYQDLTVLQNLELYADIHNIPRNARKEKFDNLLTASGLARFTDRKADKLSGGMKQKLSLICALISDPKALVLDEVSVGVDPISRADLMAIVKKMAGQGTAIIWSTSYLDEAEKCDKILLLHAGRQIYYGHPIDFIKPMEGRVYKIKPKGVANFNKRKLFKAFLNDQRVIDLTVKGDGVKIITARGSALPDLTNFEVNPLAPTLEDSYIDALNVRLVSESKIANSFSQLKDIGRTVIEAKNLTKKFANFTAADNVSFDIKQGEVFGFLGPNGAGKSTTFRMLCGLLRPTYGEARVGGIDLLLSASEARKKIGYMAQKFSLYGELNVYQNLKFFAGIYGLNAGAAKTAIEQVIENLDLESFATTESILLPLGIRQRLSLGCAILHQPSVLFLDEPTSGVDPATRREFWTHINSLADKGVTIMITTHFMDEAEYCDKIALIYKGLKINEDTPENLKKLALSPEIPDPSLEDAFITLIKRHDANEIPA